MEDTWLGSNAAVGAARQKQGAPVRTGERPGSVTPLLQRFCRLCIDWF